MLLTTIALIFGLLALIVAVALQRRMAVYGAVSLGLGLLAAATFTIGTMRPNDNMQFYLFIASMAAGLSGLIFALFGLRAHDRQWMTWVGLVLSAGVVLFWIAFAIGNVVLGV